MSNKNIKYKSKQILEFYSYNRQKWDEFYLSERRVFERVAGNGKALGDVLDVGCACGGLGCALSEKFILNSYTGIDIHEDAIKLAQEKCKLTVPTTFIAGDIIKQRLTRHYDTVVSLSCADWNVETNKIIDACWRGLKYGGYFVLSLRLTPEKGVNDIKKSYQYIKFPRDDDEKEPEVANYVVFNFREALRMMKELTPRPELIGAYGYWGNPSPTAVTPFKKLIFTVFYIRKGLENSRQKIKTKFRLPRGLSYNFHISAMTNNER